MKPWRTLLQIGLLASGTAHAAPPTAPVSLVEATRAALAHEETVRIAESRYEQSDARVAQARSRFLPSVSFQAGYSRLDQPASIYDHSWYTRLTASQSLFDGGGDWAAFGSARSEREYYEGSVAFARQNAFASIARSFYAILSGEREVDNLRKTIELAQDRVKEIRSRAKLGKSRDIELLAAQAQFAVLDAQLRAAEGQLITDRAEFALTTGLGGDVVLEDGGEPAPPQSLETYLARVEARPDIVAAKALFAAAEGDVSSARAGHFPSVGLLGNYYFGRGTTSRDVKWDVGATLTIPIFSGGETQGRVREVSARAREVELTLSQTRRQAEISIRTAYNQWVSYLNQLKSLESALRSTQQNYQEQARNYRFGQATNLDVIQALNSFQDTKRTLDRTRYTARAAWAALQAATAQAPVVSKGSP